MLKVSVLLWRWALGLCVVSALVLGLVPSPPETLSTGWDKSNHLLAFSVIMFVGYHAFPGKTMMVILGSVALGALIEVLQSFTSYRSAEWGDLLADSLGVGLGRIVVVLTNGWVTRGGATDGTQAQRDR